MIDAATVAVVVAAAVVVAPASVVDVVAVIVVVPIAGNTEFEKYNVTKMMNPVRPRKDIVRTNSSIWKGQIYSHYSIGIAIH